MDKICTKCKLPRDSEEGYYFRGGKQREQKQTICKICAGTVYVNKDEDYRRRTRKSSMKWKYKNLYNITSEKHAQLIEDQQNKCAICGIDTHLHIDHNHTTGEVRGLLCRECNMGIGKFKDNIDLLYKAINYLQNKQ